jgi:hypothetical protein
MFHKCYGDALRSLGLSDVPGWEHATQVCLACLKSAGEDPDDGVDHRIKLSNRAIKKQSLDKQRAELPPPPDVTSLWLLCCSLDV